MPVLSSPKGDEQTTSTASPLRADLLDSPQRAILEQLRAPTTGTSVEPQHIRRHLQNLSANLEFSVDQFVHGVHALTTAQAAAERVAEKSLADAAAALEERERQRVESGKSLNQMDMLRGLARVLNAQRKP